MATRNTNMHSCILLLNILPRTTCPKLTLSSAVRFSGGTGEGRESTKGGQRQGKEKSLCVVVSRCSLTTVTVFSVMKQSVSHNPTYNSLRTNPGLLFLHLPSLCVLMLFIEILMDSVQQGMSDLIT